MIIEKYFKLLGLQQNEGYEIIVYLNYKVQTELI